MAKQLHYADFTNGQKLGVVGMLPIGRYGRGHDKEGQLKPASIENGTVVTVVEVGVDYVDVKVPNEKETQRFSHMTGLRHLSLIPTNAKQAEEVLKLHPEGEDIGTGQAGPQE